MNQLDINALKHLKKAAFSQAKLLRENFPNTPHGTERYERALKRTAREFLPGVKQGHHDYSSTYLTRTGEIIHCIYQSLQDVKKKMPQIYEDNNTLLKEVLWVAHRQADANNSYTTYLDSEHTPSNISPETHHEHLIWRNHFMWFNLHRNMIHVDSATSALFEETDPPDGPLRVREFARTWPLVVLHNSKNGTTYLVSCVHDNSKESLHAEKIEDVNYEELQIYVYEHNINNNESFFALPEGLDIKKSKMVRSKGMNGVEVTWTQEEAKQMRRKHVGWILNALALAQTYPTYIKPGLKKSYHKKPRDVHIEPKELFAPIEARNLMQIVMDSRGGNKIGGLGVSPRAHWRRGHWRRQKHGVKFELENPDIQIYEDEDGNRYHMKMISALLVNRSKFTGEEPFEKISA